MAQSVKSLSKKLSQVSKQAKGLGIDTRKADAMVKQTERQGSKSFAGSREEKAYNKAISMDALNPTDVADIPTMGTPKDTGMPQLSELFDPNYSIKDNQYVYDPKKSEAENAVAQTGNSTMQLLMQKLGLQGEAPNKTDLYEDTYGISPRQAQRDFRDAQREKQNYTSQLNNIVASSQAQQLALEGQGRGQTESFVGGEQARINREATIKALPIQAQLATATANYDEAKAHLDNLFKLQSEDADAKYNRWVKVVDAVTQVATDTQANLLQVRLGEIKDKKATADQNRTLVNEWAKIAVSSGQSSLVTGFTALDPASQTFAQDFGKLQSQVVDTTSALQREASRASIRASNASSAKNEAELAALSSSYTGEFSNVVDNASNLVGAERGKTSRVAIGKALENGDYMSAYALTGNNVEESLTGETKSKFANARTDIAVMSGMRDAIQAFADAGGDMGYLKGTANEISRKFGQLTSDPKFASLAVQLQREFQAYRNNLTGAAFSPGESREYESVNPRSNASLDLNLATIDGAISQLENRVTSTINTRVPGASALYEKVSGKQTGDVIDPRQASNGTIVEIGGAKYRKVGDNAYEPL